MQYPKSNPIRSEAYRRYVASLPCDRCGIQGYSQAAHGDMNKGMGMKACDLTCYPACGPHNGKPGCHYTVGSTGTLSRDERREYEQQAANRTQESLIEMSWSDHKLRAVLQRVGLVK